jgi:hypothetical protein
MTDARLVATARGKKTAKAPDSWDDIQQLALSIDGYEVAGGERCGALANALAEQYHRVGSAAFSEVSTEDIRCALFFEQRRWRHFGEEPDGRAMGYILALVTELGKRNGIPWLWDQVKQYRDRERRST